MARYMFTAEARTFECEAATTLEAYGQANAHFGSLPQGAWMESAQASRYGVDRRFYWAAGNYFD